MNIDFSFWLLVLVLISGLIWLVDALVFARQRKQEFHNFLKSNNIEAKAIRDYRKQALKGEAPKISQKLQKQFSDAFAIEKESALVEYSKSFFPILFAVLFFRSFLFEPFQIPTGSMIPSLNVGDYILVNKHSYGVRLPVVGTEVIPVGEPQRGDVMVFIPPHDPVYYVKRVIGLPGDHVRYEDKTLYINGVEQTQEFVATEHDGRRSVNHYIEELGEVSHDIYTSPVSSYFRDDFWMQPGGRVIPEGHYFMMGDNRDNSDDSRRWGVVPESNIVGKAVAVWMHKEPGLSLPTFSENRLINP
ncbi:MAG: signal peptidase I [Gammaproteobacteria bacterium]|nr:signal peptidase I [Gammaproteobacteria bacterium]MAY03318.1 signal peptidase I [Gammaproteobacteria bacterium]|tara:strand:- start:493 stop:1398 length:906 start_codon:yes stop_codon:yes gene_type:complete